MREWRKGKDGGWRRSEGVCDGEGSKKSKSKVRIF